MFKTGNKGELLIPGIGLGAAVIQGLIGAHKQRKAAHAAARLRRMDREQRAEDVKEARIGSREEMAQRGMQSSTVASKAQADISRKSRQALAEERLRKNLASAEQTRFPEALMEGGIAPAMQVYAGYKHNKI